MNLIEQLGGYEEAKMLRGTTSNALLDMKTWTVHVDDIDLALLEYRRANNIFEVGDKVVYKGEAGLNGLFEIERLTKTGKPKTVKTERFGNFPCRYCEVQHATDAEIQAGHRLMKPNDFLIVMLLSIVFCVAAGHGNLQHHALINL